MTAKIRCETGVFGVEPTSIEQGVDGRMPNLSM